jgi:hypothetical protein
MPQTPSHYQIFLRHYTHSIITQNHPTNSCRTGSVVKQLQEWQHLTKLACYSQSIQCVTYSMRDPCMNQQYSRKLHNSSMYDTATKHQVNPPVVCCFIISLIMCWTDQSASQKAELVFLAKKSKWRLFKEVQLRGTIRTTVTIMIN